MFLFCSRDKLTVYVSISDRCVAQYRNWEKMNRPWDSQLIIGISANPNINNNGQGLHAGMNAFLPKPITVKTLSDLECSSEVVFRTRQLDEYAATTPQPTDNNTKLSISERNVSLSMPSSQLPVRESGRMDTSTQLSCLIATDTVGAQTNPLPQQLESMGWNVAIVHDGIDCLDMLKFHTWTAVLMEDDLTQLSGFSCITAFRKWEGLNRMDHQRNIYYVCDGDIPSPVDGDSCLLPPNGFNGVLRKPVPWVDLQYMLMRNKNGGNAFNTGAAGSIRQQSQGGW
jgi:CheY-like chemotaxis protein